MNNPGPILIAVFITEMVIPFKHVIIISSSSSSIQRLWRRLTNDDHISLSISEPGYDSLKFNFVRVRLQLKKRVNG